MKRCLALLLALVLCLSLSACGDDSTATDPTPSKNPPPTGFSPPKTTPKSQEAPEEPMTVSIADIAEREIFNQNGITVTFSFADADGLSGLELHLFVENNSDKEISLDAINASINDVMMDTFIPDKISSGKKANTYINFYSDELERAGIQTVKNVEFTLRVMEPSSWTTLCESEPIIIAAPGDEDYSQTYDDSGLTIVDQNDIKIVVRELQAETTSWDTRLQLYIENNGTVDATIRTDDTSVNDFMLYALFHCEVQAGKKSFTDFSFSNDDLVANDISSIQTIETIFEARTWREPKETIFETEPITITLE